MNIKKLENICAIILIVALFLPWVSMGMLGSLSGFKLAQLGGSATLLWLVPLLAIGVLVSDVMNMDEKISSYIAYAAGALPTLWVISRMFVMGFGVFFEAAGIGFYLTLLAGIGILLGAFGVVKIPE